MKINASLTNYNHLKYKAVTFKSNDVSHVCFQRHNGVIDP